jgi:hypothetical protein
MAHRRIREAFERLRARMREGAQEVERYVGYLESMEAWRGSAPGLHALNIVADRDGMHGLVLLAARIRPVTVF